jgi:hypothetical protein
MKNTRWTSYGEIFNQIVSSIHNDYAAFGEVRGRDLPRLGVRVSLYNSRSFHGDDDKFLKYVRRYLRTLGDPNLRLTKANPDPIRDWSPGFSVRAGENALFVTECFGEQRLRPGDQIQKIDGLSPIEYRRGLRGLTLYGNTPERELWDYCLQYAAELTCRSGNREYTIAPAHFPLPAPSDRISFETPAPGVALLTLDHLEDPEGVLALAEKHEASITGSQTLILDLRRCRGGYIDSVFPLLTWLIDKPVNAAELFQEKGLWVKDSVENRRRLGDLSFPAARTEEFVWMPYDFLPDLDVTITPAGGPARVLILTDLFCRDEAEIFLRMAAPLPKVRLIGRSSLGNSDYQEPVTLSFENDLFFTYPAGRTEAAAEGRGVYPQGVPVDLYLPWTEEECRRDVILAKALELAVQA